VDPADDKGSYHWSGTAINLATSVGMHRTTVGTVMTPSDRKLWRRIWWCIYYRDRQGSMVINRPIRTDYDREIDVEMLSDEDFDSDKDHNEIHPCCGKFDPQQVALVVHMVKLADLVPRIADCRMSLIRNPGSAQLIAECDNLLDEWERQVPDTLRWSAVTQSLAAAGLYLSYRSSSACQNFYLCY
jgi:hypothetical protein